MMIAPFYTPVPEDVSYDDFRRAQVRLTELTAPIDSVDSRPARTTPPKRDSEFMWLRLCDII